MQVLREEAEEFVKRWSRLIPNAHSEDHLRKVYALTNDDSTVAHPSLAQEIILTAQTPEGIAKTLQQRYKYEDGFIEKARLELGLPSIEGAVTTASGVVDGAADAVVATAVGTVAGSVITSAAASATKNLIADVTSSVADSFVPPTPPPKPKRTYNKRKQPPPPTPEPTTSPIFEQVKSVLTGSSSSTPEVGLLPSDPNEPLTGSKTPVEGSSQAPTASKRQALDTESPTSMPTQIPTPTPSPTPVPTPEPATTTPTDSFPQVDLSTQQRSQSFDAIGRLSQQIFMSGLYASGNGAWMASNQDQVNAGLSSLDSSLRATIDDKNLHPKLKEALLNRFAQGKDEANMVTIQDGNKLASVNDVNTVDSVVTDVALRIQAPDPWELDMQSRQNALRRELQPWGQP